MSEKDLKINASVRRILVEHDLDLTVLSVSATGGSVKIRGRLRKLSLRSMGDSLMVRTLVMLENAIMRTKHVRRVSFSIKGWEKKRGRWKKIEKAFAKKKKPKPPPPEESAEENEET